MSPRVGVKNVSISVDGLDLGEHLRVAGWSLDDAGLWWRADEAGALFHRFRRFPRGDERALCGWALPVTGATTTGHKPEPIETCPPCAVAERLL